MTRISSRQLIIIHVSDLHFGEDHKFMPDPIASGATPKESVPSLVDSLLKDLGTYDNFPSVIIAATGDFTCKSKADEFKTARQFLEGFVGKTICGTTITKANIFIVPGNHDKDYTVDSQDLAWQNYYSFYQSFYGSSSTERRLQSNDQEDFFRVHNRWNDLDAVIVELNSCMYIKKDTELQNRGFIDERSIDELEKQLKALPSEVKKKAIKIAMLHHHPVLIPGLVEAGREYDAVHHAGLLLRTLNDHRFHLILHGHKHQPYVFSYDALCGWNKGETHPLLVVAGGSASSKELATVPIACNTYNFINMRYSWSSKEMKANIQIKGLETHRTDGEPLTKSNWKWNTLRDIDKLLSPPPQKPSSEKVVKRREFNSKKDATWEKGRTAVYAHLRGNMPVVDIVPSLEPGQEYQAHMRIVAHGDRDIPTEVTYFAGPKHQVNVCKPRNNSDFENVMAYYDGMLIKVIMNFADGKTATTHMYAQLPIRD